MNNIFFLNSRAFLGYPILKNSSNNPVECKDIDDVDKACKIVNTDPTPLQKITENYRKAHIRIKGLNITIENPKGSIRSKQRPDGSLIWAAKMPAHYGYIKRTIGADFDQVDCFIGKHYKSDFVYIVDQKHHESGKFDESKCMIWFKTMKQAVKCYCESFSDGSGPDRIMSISGLDWESFQRWLKTNAPLQQMLNDFKQATPDEGKRQPMDRR